MWEEIPYDKMKRILFFLMTCNLVAWGKKHHEANGDLSSDQHVMLQHTIKNMLGYEKLPSDPKSKSTVMETAPKYMLDLYEKYRNGRFKKDEDRGNTVRSIHASIVKVNGQVMFYFNLSSIPSTEKIMSAEMHLYKKKMKTRPTSKEIKIMLHEVAPVYMSQIGTRTLSPFSYGWQWFDITDSIKSCSSTQRTRTHSLSINFETVKENRDSANNIVLKRFMRHMEKPFIIIFSKAIDQNITVDHVDPHFKTEDLLEFNKNENEIMKALRPVNKHNQRKNRKRKDSHEKQSMRNSVETRKQNRERRSIYDNEIPEDPIEPPRSTSMYNVPVTHPGILQERQQIKPRKPPKKLIPYPPKFNKSRRSRERNRNKNKKRRKNKGSKRQPLLPIPRNVQPWQQENNQIPIDRTLLCGRRRLVVDLADIGWSKWVIAPKSFDVHYCAGQCSFPLSRGMKPSNHATIQSLVHAIGINSHVPPPCCVPESMSSITLLYVDEDRNVILKNYPNMSVNSCACR
ncbi:unnamed protein product [Owenia fusiformis]|uniref:Uncharacterized protein n=1 Tax=Owenia fusiformis TaxID=6347 RepID=A0A8J1Y672_OWEFU|nr:unnamed protein product [Owenia fusiformis]